VRVTVSVVKWSQVSVTKTSVLHTCKSAQMTQITGWKGKYHLKNRPKHNTLNKNPIAGPWEFRLFHENLYFNNFPNVDAPGFSNIASMSENWNGVGNSGPSGAWLASSSFRAAGNEDNETANVSSSGATVLDHDATVVRIVALKST
jgi:hypothetical protein